MKKYSILNWSSGKDSAFTLYKILQDPTVDIKYLFTTINKELDRISMHGVKSSLLRKQAEELQLPLKILRLPLEPTLDEYNDLMHQELRSLINDGIKYSIFGDIFLEDLRKYREEKLREVGMKALFPLWKFDTLELIKEFIRLGFKAKIVCVNAGYFDKSFCGIELDENFLSRIPKDVDPCGENGEYHTFVYDGPIFRKPIDFETGEIAYKEYKPCNEDKKRCDKDCDKGKSNIGFWYCDLV